MRSGQLKKWYVGVGLGEGVFAKAVGDFWAGVAAGDEFGVDFPF